MNKDMLEHFKNLKFQKKIFIICLLTSFLPTIILGFFCYNQVRDLLIDREKTVLRDSLLQENLRISSRLSEYDNIANYIIWNNDVLKILNGKYTTNYEMYVAYTKSLEPFTTTLQYLYPDISEITIYSDLKIYPRKTKLEPLSEISHLSWYADACNTLRPIWLYSSDEHTLSLVNRFYDIPADQTSLIVVTLDYDQVFSTLSSLYTESYGVMLIDGQGRQIYQYKTADMQNDPLSAEQLINARLHTKELAPYIIETVPTLNNDWTLCIYRPVSTITEPIQVITSTIVVIIFICLLLVLLLSSWLSSMIVRPLEKLSDNMRQVEQGNYKVTVSYHSSDEVGQLLQTFEHMVHELNHLINETLNAKILQTKLELKSLQAQINPHFFYNSLSLINSKAILAGQHEIGQVTRYLSTFYRTSLNKGKDLISVQDELENVRSYINIQLMMHSDSFDVVYDIDEEALSCSMINLMLQPLVENALKHGIDCKTTSERGCLIIAIRPAGSNLLLQVSDNGPGIPEAQLAKILTSNSDGYGIGNVHTRAQLQYGKQYGLSYRSEIDKGTVATLTIPKQYFPDSPITP